MTDKNQYKTYKDLIAWKKSHKVVLHIYKITKTFPQEEQFGLASQMRRAAVSVTSNLAEGYGRKSAKDKARFYIMARGSLIEIDNQLTIACDVGYMTRAQFEAIIEQLEEAHKILNGLIRSLETKYD